MLSVEFLDLEGKAELGGGVQTLATRGPPGSCLHISVPLVQCLQALM